jgi:hypothetical protein
VAGVFVVPTSGVTLVTTRRRGRRCFLQVLAALCDVLLMTRVVIRHPTTR